MIQDIITYFSEDGGQYVSYLIQHLRLSLIALVIAMIIGIPLGYISYKHEKVAEFFTTTSQLLRIIPSLAILFILIPIIGVGEVPALIALVFLGVPPILVNTILGFNEIPAVTKEVAIGIGMNEIQLRKRIEFPLAMPFILNGVKLSLVEIIASATLATYIGAGGLGTLIFTGLGLYRMDLLVIGGGTVTILSLLSMFILDFIIRKVSENSVEISN
ncbi:ABC transporter permease [Aerococcus agrisoli]|uniref:ABC transporter permease n=1 Tax=Aerococcus agrisoli TaxID=2487350 RepID=A0A3N4GHT1_9LACT|nr:ABC transporter permease [Aerococcus agrisoli]RPA60987.1 ABC transporter permease [Aerococcus agrisoli]